MKTKLFLLVPFLFAVLSLHAQYNETWQDHGNGLSYLIFTGTEGSGQDVALCTDNYDYSSETVAIPLSPGAATKNAFRFVKNDTGTSQGPHIVLDVNNGTLANTPTNGSDVIVNVQVYIYVVADTDATQTNSVDLSDFYLKSPWTNHNYESRVRCRLQSSTGSAQITSDLWLTSFNPGWQELQFAFTVPGATVANLNEYDKFRIEFPKPLNNGHSSGLYYYSNEVTSDDDDFIDEKVYFYVGSIKSNIALDATQNTLSVNDKEFSSQVSFYPNPVSSSLKISKEITKGMVYDVTGKLIEEVKNVKTIDVSAYSKGSQRQWM